jgi:hypothetical protein
MERQKSVKLQRYLLILHFVMREDVKSALKMTVFLIYMMNRISKSLFINVIYV